MELGDGGVAAAVLGDDEVDPVELHELCLTFDAERATGEDHLCRVQRQSRRRIDRANQPPALPVDPGDEGSQVASTGGEEHPPRWTSRDGGRGSCHVGNHRPAVPPLRLPPRPFKAEPRYPGLATGVVRLLVHRLGEGVRGVHDRCDALRPEVRDQAARAAEPADPSVSGQGGGRCRPSRQRGHDRHVVACGQRLGQTAGLGRPPEQQHAKRGGHGGGR